MSHLIEEAKLKLGGQGPDPDKLEEASPNESDKPNEASPNESEATGSSQTLSCKA